MLICELQTHRSIAGQVNNAPYGFLIGHSLGRRSRLARSKLRIASLTKDQKSYVLDTLSKHHFSKESQEVLEWLQGDDGASKFSLSTTKERARLADVLGKLEDFTELEVLKDDSASQETKTHFLVSFVQKVYTKVLKKERKKFAEEFDQTAERVRL